MNKQSNDFLNIVFPFFFTSTFHTALFRKPHCNVFLRTSYWDDPTTSRIASLKIFRVINSHIDLSGRKILVDEQTSISEKSL